MTSLTSTRSTRSTRNLVLYFQVHQPKRLRALRFFDIGSNSAYFDDDLNGDIIRRVATSCYLPTNALLLRLIQTYPGIRVTFSISGVTLEQFEEFAPEVLLSFRKLAETGAVDFLTETYYHSLASAMPGNEFELQAAKHQKAILSYFGVTSKVFRNTELIYNDETGERISRLGFKGTIIDGVDRVVSPYGPHRVFEHPNAPLKILARNYRLSDDISFRYANNAATLTASQYINWINAIPASEDMLMLGMDYETFGEHQKKESRILTFLETLLAELSQNKDLRFMTASEAAEEAPAAKLSVPNFISWADQERDLSAWLGNDMQRDAFDSLIKAEGDIKNLHDKALLRQWRTLQTSDHFYYMSTKGGSDGEVHNYFSPYPSPYEAFINYMNVLTDFTLRLKILKSSAAIRNSETAPASPADMEISL